MELLDLNEAEIPLDKLEYGPESVGENSNSYLFSPEGSSSLKSKSKPKVSSNPSNATALWSPLDKSTASYSANFDSAGETDYVQDEAAQYRSPGPKKAPRLQVAAAGAHAVSDGEDEEGDAHDYDDYADDDNVQLGESRDHYEEDDPFDEDDDEEMEAYHRDPSPQKSRSHNASHSNSSPSKGKSHYSASQVLELVDAELHRLQKQKQARQSMEQEELGASDGEQNEDDESSGSVVGRDVFPEDSFADDGAEPVFTYKDFEFLPPKDAGSSRHARESSVMEPSRKHRSRHGSGASSSNPSQRGNRSSGGGGGAPRAGAKKGPYAKENLVLPPQMRKRRPGESEDPAVKQAIKEKTAKQKVVGFILIENYTTSF
jgi:hypothetical protein